MNFSAVILAGGKSARMGRDKAWLEIGGRSLLSRQIELARTAGATEVLISGRTDTDYSRLNCPVLQDRFPNAGPLAGIDRALESMVTSMLLVLAVDMPEMAAEFLDKLRARCAENCGVVPQLRGRMEPLAAFYAKSTRAIAAEMLGDKQAGPAIRTSGPTDFARECVKRKLATLMEVTDADARYFTNMNSPADLPPKPGSVL